MEEIGVTLRALRMDGGRIPAYIGRRPRVEGTEVLKRIGAIGCQPRYRQEAI